MFYFKSQKQYFTLLVAVFFFTMCFGQVKSPAFDLLKVGVTPEANVPVQKKSNENTMLLCRKFKLLSIDLNSLEKNKFVWCEKSFNKYLQKNELYAVVRSFKMMLSLKRSTIESICIKHPIEIKEIYLFLARDVKAVKSIK